MINLRIKHLKRKWFKKYKKNILSQEKEYYTKDLSEIYGFDSKLSLFCITLYDSVNNNELNKLIERLYKLKKNKNFDVDISYRKKRIKNLDYIRPEFDSTGHGSVAKIKLLDDDMLSCIEMAWTQINNDEAVVEYVCYFKRCIDNFNTIHNYFISNYKQLKKIKYANFYFNIDFFKNDDNQNIQVELEYFRILIQNKISKLSYSHYLNKYLLPIKYTYIFDKKTKSIMSNIKKPFLGTSYILDKDHYICIESHEEHQGTEFNEIIFKDRFNPIDFVSLLSRIRMPFYYQMFYQIEKAELQFKITKYLNSKRSSINFTNYKWLLNKRRRINEKRFHNIDIDKEIKLKGYSDKNSEFIDIDLYNGIKDVYNDNIEYIKNLNSLNYNIVAFVISILALIISIIGFAYNVASNTDNKSDNNQKIIISENYNKHKRPITK